jgi:type IV pilus assembly protein PilV
MNARKRQDGTSLIEVLVALVISMIGILGMIATQMQAYTANAESYQRANAELLLQDMVGRINDNRRNAADYVAADIGVGPLEDCEAAADLVQGDLCTWGNLLRGATEKVDQSMVGAMSGARGCIAALDARTYVVSVVWEGTNASGAAATSCGKDQYADERLRRGVTAVVRIADLGA